MRIALRTAACSALLVAIRLNAGTDPFTAPGPSGLLRPTTEMRSRRSHGDAVRRRLQKQREIKKAIREKRLIAGMTQKDVLSAWGWPELTHPVHGIDESTDRWTYRRRGQGLVDLYFRNGILIHIGR